MANLSVFKSLSASAIPWQGSQNTQNTITLTIDMYYKEEGAHCHLAFHRNNIGKDSGRDQSTDPWLASPHGVRDGICCMGPHTQSIANQEGSPWPFDVQNNFWGACLHAIFLSLTLPMNWGNTHSLQLFQRSEMKWPSSPIIIHIAAPGQRPNHSLSQVNSPPCTWQHHWALPAILSSFALWVTGAR